MCFKLIELVTSLNQNIPILRHLKTPYSCRQ